MPVTTRSMARINKEHVENTTCVNTGGDSIYSVPSLDDPSVSSSSSSSQNSSLMSLSDDDFGISNVQNFELSSVSMSAFNSHNLNSSQFVRKESDCEDTQPVVKNDNTMLTQDTIMKMLDAISLQMVTNYQNVQAQLTQTAADLQRVTQDNETFRRAIRNELNLLRSSPQPPS
jgi:hypothetical protein